MDEKKEPEPSQPAPQPTTWSWSSLSSWPTPLKALPVIIAFTSILLAQLFPTLIDPRAIANLFSPPSPCVRNFTYPFPLARAKLHAEASSSLPAELGTTAQALLELLDPHRAVFAPDPFPNGKVPWSWLTMEEGLVYAHKNVRFAPGWTLVEDAFSVSGPASLGISAVMIGQHWPGWLEAAGRQAAFLVELAPRYEGAISHRVEVAEVWADAVGMVPPFLAYYAAAGRNASLISEAIRQCEVHRHILRIREGRREGLWRRAVGAEETADEGAWSTGNGQAAYGMLRVRATVAAFDTGGVMRREMAALDAWVLEILDGAVRTDDDESGLLRNYLGDPRWWGETSGTSLLAAAAYRMAMFMAPSARRTELLAWADRKRRVVAANVNGDGVAGPAVNPYGPNQEQPLEGISAEGEAFLLMMGAAWRDCVCGGVCEREEGVA